MDTVATYRQIIEQLLADYAKLPYAYKIGWCLPACVATAYLQQPLLQV